MRLEVVKVYNLSYANDCDVRVGIYVYLLLLAIQNTGFFVETDN